MNANAHNRTATIFGEPATAPGSAPLARRVRFANPSEDAAANPTTSVASVLRAAGTPSALERPFQNIYACLVHERPECVVDLVRNLRFNDPAAVILLYNGSADPWLLRNVVALERLGAMVHPTPRPMRWGWLHEFALDSMRFALDNVAFDALTIVDSDQLSVRAGYSQRLAAYFAAHPKAGMLGSAPNPQPRSTRLGPATQAWREVELWRPFLRRFANGEALFPLWTFWPSTVFTADAARALVDFVSGDEQLAGILSRTNIWASEEVVLPTLTALLGFEIAPSPSSYDYVRYRVACDDRELDTALARPDVYWIHPVARSYDDKLRSTIRRRCGEYELNPRAARMMSSTDSEPHDLLLTLPILERMREVEGWFDDDEADLLIAITARALREAADSPTLLEVGSYCGRSTTVLGSVAKAIRPDTRIFAVDPHDGVIGALDQGLQYAAPTLEKFRRNMEHAGLTSLVEPIVAKSTDVSWDRPIDLLLIDGLHDYASVARDFHHFAKFVVSGGYVVFHDYAAYYPGVVAFVHECLSNDEYRKIAIRRSLCVLQRSTSANRSS